MSTLLIKNDGIGDLVLSSGLITDMAKAFGPLDLITCAANREIADNIPGLRTVFYVSRDKIQYNPLLARVGIKWRRFTSQDKTVFEHLKSTRYDTAICLRRYIRQSSLLLMHSVQARRKECCWRWPTNASLSQASELTHGWNRFEGSEINKNELAYFRDFLLERFNLISTSRPRLICTEDIVATPEPQRLGLCLSGGFKNWPLPHWVELAERLSRTGKQLVLFGGPDALACASAIKQRLPSVVSYVNSLSLTAAVPELARLDLLISNDTGFAHFAGTVVRRLIVILGGGTYHHFFPWPESERHYIIYHGMQCYGCNWKCSLPKMECFARITVSSVFEYVSAALTDNAERLFNTANTIGKMT